MNTFKTSYNTGHSLDLVFSGQTLIFQNMPLDCLGRSFSIHIKNLRGVEVFHLCDQVASRYRIDLSVLPKETFLIDLYFSCGDTYWSFFSGNYPMFEKARNCRFLSSPLQLYNYQQSQRLTTELADTHRWQRSEKMCQSSHPDVVDCAHELARGNLFNYSRMLAVHDYVARNIAYDCDALESGNYRFADNSALGTLHKGRSVCQGYANLSVALLRALGIPARVVYCYALGEGTNGAWDTQNNLKAKESDHVITAAFVDQQWHFMDVTWDSDLKYVGGNRQIKTGLGVRHHYFDMTIPSLSLTHKLFVR